MTLAELLATEPYASQDDATAAAAINAATVQVWQDIEWLELTIWTHTEGIERATLETAATSGGTAATRTAAQHVLDCINAGMPLSGSDSRVRELIQASSLSGAAKAALVALAQVDVPIASTLVPSFSVVYWHDVARARGGNP